MNCDESYSVEIVFNQNDVNTFCRIMNLEHTAHDDIQQAELLGYNQTIVPVIFAMSTTLSVLNDCIFTKYEPLELCREYTCVRPIFTNQVYRIDYILKHLDHEDKIGTVVVRLKNNKGQICVNGLVKLKLISLRNDNV